MLIKHSNLFLINQFPIKRRNPLNKAWTDDTIKNSMYRSTDVFNNHIET